MEGINSSLRLVNIDSRLAKKAKGRTWHELATETSFRQNQESSFPMGCGHFMPHDVLSSKTKIEITQANQKPAKPALWAVYAFRFDYRAGPINEQILLDDSNRSSAINLAWHRPIDRWRL
jgi:hypothetical protein